MGVKDVRGSDGLPVSNQSEERCLLHAMQHAGCNICRLLNVFAVQMFVYCIGFKYRRNLRIIALVIMVGNNILHYVSAVSTVVIMVLRK